MSKAGRPGGQTGPRSGPGRGPGRGPSGPRGAKRPGTARPRAPFADTRDAASTAIGADAAARLGWRQAIEKTVAGLHYELVDVERAPRGLLRVTLDRVPGHAYPTGPGEFVLVEDCELVTRQLQYALEVEGLEYARLEVSSPGLDRPLKRVEDYVRFAGSQVALTLKQPFQGRKVFKGVLGRAEAAEGVEAGWQLVFDDGKGGQVLGFALEEVRDARLVPVLDFKGRRTPAAQPQADDAPVDGE